MRRLMTVSSMRLAFAMLLAVFAWLGNVCEFSDENHTLVVPAAGDSTRPREAQHQAVDHTAWCDETVVPASFLAHVTPDVASLPPLVLTISLIVALSSRREGKAAAPLRRSPLFLLHAALLI